MLNNCGNLHRKPNVHWDVHWNVHWRTLERTLAYTGKTHAFFTPALGRAGTLRMRAGAHRRHLPECGRACKNAASESLRAPKIRAGAHKLPRPFDDGAQDGWTNLATHTYRVGLESVRIPVYLFHSLDVYAHNYERRRTRDHLRPKATLNSSS